MAGVPYVGCGVLASAAGMDKIVMKQLFKQSGLLVGDYEWFTRGAWEEDPDGVISKDSPLARLPGICKAREPRLVGRHLEGGGQERAARRN